MKQTEWPARFPSALATTRTVVRALIVLNLVFGVGILALFVASLVARDWVFAALGVASPIPG